LNVSADGCSKLVVRAPPRRAVKIIWKYYVAVLFRLSNSNAGLSYLTVRRRLGPRPVGGVLLEQNHAGSSLDRHHPRSPRRKPWLCAAVRRRLRGWRRWLSIFGSRAQPRSAFFSISWPCSHGPNAS